MGDMYYEGMHDYEESFIEEEGMKQPSVSPCVTLIEENPVDELILADKRGEDKAYYESLIVGGMTYDEGINDELFLLEGEYYENKKYIDEPIMGMACFKDIHIDHKEDKSLIEQISIEASLYENDYFLKTTQKWMKTTKMRWMKYVSWRRNMLMSILLRRHTRPKIGFGGG